MNFDVGEYYLFTFSNDDCYDEGELWFDTGYTLAYCEKFMRDRVCLQVLGWQHGVFGWMSMTFLEHSPDSEKFSDIDDNGKSLLFDAAFSGSYYGDGSPQFGVIWNYEEDN